MPRHHLLAAVTAAGAALALGAGTAPAADAPAAPKAQSVLNATLTASGTTRADCFASLRPGAPGIATRTVRVSDPGYVDLRMTGASGEWDVAVFNASGQAVAADATPGADEVATGWNLEAGDLQVQACRRSGDAASVAVDMSFTELTGDAKAAKADPPQLVNVITPTRADKDRLTALGLDMTEHGGFKSLGVVLHGRDDANKLLQAGFRWRTMVPDLLAQDVQSRSLEGRPSAEAPRIAARRRAAAVGGPTYPTMAERTTYRTLAEYNALMRKMAEENPGLVRLFEMPNKTWEGRTVLGVEIARDVARNDGRPSFLNMGVHHAREWPSSEHAMEWAVELLNGYSKGDARATRIVEQSRNIVVPLVNPDGFNASRTAGALTNGNAGRDPSVPDTAYIVAGVGNGGEYRRKNCRIMNQNAGNCGTSAGLAELGTDPNRNYGGLWGGPGADTNFATQTYRGPTPFSEPETRNIQWLVSRNQVMSLITNHTTAGLVLRAPGIAALGDPVDENKGYKQLGDDMSLHNGYFSQKSFELYDTTGTTEDWSYNATGGYGFTFEIFCQVPNYKTGDCNDPAFHPTFKLIADEYVGNSDQANHKNDPGRSEEAPFGNVKGFDGQGNREAYYIAAESALNEQRHSIIETEAPPGTTLRLKKEFKTQTFPQASNGGKPIEFDDKLETVYDVDGTGKVRWHVNPSTRPIVAKDIGDKEGGEPSPPEEQDGGPNGYSKDPNNDGAGPGGDADTTNSRFYNDHPIVIPAEGDNRSANIRVSWLSPASDWDLKLFEDVNGDGKSNEGDKEVGVSENGATTEEEVGITGTPKLEPGKKYVLRVVNFAAAEQYNVEIEYAGPLPFQPARVESYTLTCERGDQVLDTQLVQIDRGQVKQVTLGNGCARAAGTGTTPGTNQTGTTPGTTQKPGSGTSACTAGGGFRSASVSPRGRGATLGFDRRLQRPVTVSVFQQSRGRRVTGERLVARFANRSSAVKWNGRATVRGKKVTDGYYFVRYRMETPGGSDVRRVVVRRSNGKFARRGDFYRRATCDLLPSFKLTRPVFGGSGRPANLQAAFRVAEQSRVSAEVLRGSKVVRRFAARNVLANRTTRLRIASTGLPRGDYRVRITVVAGSKRLTTTLVSRRL